MKAGDIVEYKKEDYLAIKVNTKTIYICKNRNFLNIWQNRVSGTKWKDLCAREEAIMVKVTDVILKEENAVKVPERPSKKNKILSSEAERKIKECFNRNLKREKGQKTKSPFFLIESENERIWPLSVNIEKNLVLFHNLSDDSYHFFDVEKNIYSEFLKEKNIVGKDILWP
jgi:hypothetical protein